MSQALATQADPPRTAMTIAAGLKPHIADTLPDYIKPDAFMRTVQTAIQVQPDLLQATPRSLMVACMKAAADGLILDGREAALVIRNVKIASKGKGGATADKWEKQAVYQPMVQGLMKLARNSGEVSSIIAHVVYKNDRFHYVLGDDERIEHEPAPFDEEQGEPIAVYAIVKLRDGTTIREVMRKAAVMNIAGQGQNAYQYNPESGKNFAEWWRKTVIRRISKYMPRSSDAIGRLTQAAERIDEDFEYGEVEQEGPAAAQVTQLKRRGAAAAALKDITPAREPDREEIPPNDGDDYDPETGEIEDGVVDDTDYAEQRPGDDI